jgi:hypothetical protein
MNSKEMWQKNINITSCFHRKSSNVSLQYSTASEVPWALYVRAF